MLPKRLWRNWARNATKGCSKTRRHFICLENVYMFEVSKCMEEMSYIGLKHIDWLCMVSDDLSRIFDCSIPEISLPPPYAYTLYGRIKITATFGTPFIFVFTYFPRDKKSWWKHNRNTLANDLFLLLRIRLIWNDWPFFYFHYVHEAIDSPESIGNM